MRSRGCPKGSLASAVVGGEEGEKYVLRGHLGSTEVGRKEGAIGESLKGSSIERLEEKKEKKTLSGVTWIPVLKVLKREKFFALILKSLLFYS